MTHLHNDPADFADEALAGFAAAHAARVRPVDGGVVRAHGTPAGQVAVVIGGGSGHYPAFAGLVGRGLAHGAAAGNVFASPSARQVRSVATAAHGGAGVLLLFGNYAGDVLHFGEAAQRLTADGIPTETFAVTDDIAAAPPGERRDRRGIAGDLPVFKAAAAAAEQGLPLAEVLAAARHADARTRSFGIAFGGCTLPGADAPLFTVPEGRMAVGLGIHGEPGIGEAPLPTADEAAELLVETLLAELPDGVDSPAGRRAAVLLNGLGAVTYEELFVVYRTVARLLGEAGVRIVEPEVGELVTSFDMAGVSLTLTWLDDRLADLWAAPADTPAHRKGALPADAPAPVPGPEAAAVDGAVPPPRTRPQQPATAESRAAAARIAEALAAVAAVVDAHVDELGRIDAVAGDGDHGIGMQRGAHAAASAAESARSGGAGAGGLLHAAADAWADRAGGTSGALWGAALRALGESLGDREAPTAATVAAGVAEATAAVRRLGGADVGDKTMVDVLVPFADALHAAVAAGARTADAWDGAAGVAGTAAAATADLLPRRGRARPHAERSLGTPDAGAHSLALIVRAVHPVLTGAATPTDRPTPKDTP